MMRRAEILVSGLVQGVAFRYNTTRRADELRLTGIVRNLRDGRVEIVCEGAEEEIEKLIEWCNRGSGGAIVKHVDVAWKDYTGELKDFRIVH